ncbi:MAG: SWIM zinc finger family protein [Selenomonadaceae bacterium]|nr:SWIM zinc finger family protein [Selenomonadaceae bacterium]
MKICKKCGKEFEGENIYCMACRWEMKWPHEILNAPELATRRKRSHNVKLISIDKINATAEFQSSSKGKTYETTLGHCTCKDFALGHGEHPCKHILRLAEELGLFENEKFLSGERDYTIDKSSLHGSLKENIHSCQDCSYIWRTRWPYKILTSVELANRRKLSHKVNIVSFDSDKIESVCEDSDGKESYVTTLTSCTCMDFNNGFGIRPCKHILHLAEELNLFYCENEDENALKFSFKDLDDSKESKKIKRSLSKVWKEKLYGFNTFEEGVDFIKNLKLTLSQLKEFSQLAGLNVVFSGRKKAEIIDNIVDRTVGHSHRQLLRWLANEIYKRNDLDECAKFIKGLNLTVQQIKDFAEFKQINLVGNDKDELIKSLVDETVGKTSKYTGNVIHIQLNVDEALEKMMLQPKSNDTTEAIASSQAQENINTSESQFPTEEITGQIEKESSYSKKENLHKSNFFVKALRYCFSFLMCLIAIVCVLGTISRASIAPKELIIPVMMSVLGTVIAVSAKKIGLQGSILKWWLYSTFVPVVSWMDVLMAHSKNKNFMKNLAICVIGFLIWIVMFVEIIEPQKTKEKSQQIQTVVREAGK